jgi:hypothetical protein
VITLKYKEGEKKIVVVPETMIVTYVPGDKSELKPGSKSSSLPLTRRTTVRSKPPPSRSGATASRRRCELPGETHTSTVLHSDPPGPRLHLWGPQFSRWPKHHSQERAASARMNVCGTFPRSMPHLTGARSLGHQPNVQISFYV